jgi:hypothetical protein
MDTFVTKIELRQLKVAWGAESAPDGVVKIHA